NDIPGSQDHPLITRYPGADITWYQTDKYREYNLAFGPITGYRQISDRKTIAGQLYRIYYEISATPQEVSLGEIYADYKRAFQRDGITMLGQGFHPEGGQKNDIGTSKWIGIALRDQGFSNGATANKLFAGTASSGGTFAIIGQMEKAGSTVYIAIYGERHSNTLIGYHIDIIETKKAELGQVSINPNYLSKELDERGSVKIYGLQFDFDSAILRPVSKNTVEQIAIYLKQNPGDHLYVVGHTDMQGSLAYNRQLSTDRAQAVIDALVKTHGIQSDRLIPAGLAFLAPVATNATEAGRKENRRVELVRRK
ncbi:MAG: OmpA family protein, partial [Bacteroidota bacterium]